MAIKDITLGKYVHSDSFLHRLDPRAKLISLLVVMTGLFSANGLASLLMAGLFTALAATVSGLKWSYLFRSLLPFKWLILITLLLNILFVGGHIIVEAPLPYGGVTAEGLSAGMVYGIRLALLILLASILTLTTQPVVLVAGIEKLLGPLKLLKIDPHEIAIAMVITIRFIPVLLGEAEKIRKSQVARGLKPGGGPIRRMRSMTHLIMPLVMSSLRRAEELAVAMECRLYRGSADRTRYHEIHMTSWDWTVIVGTLIFTIGIMVT